MTVKSFFLVALITLSLQGCTAALYLFNDGTADPISGHQIGIGNPEKIVDIGETRVRMSPVRSVRQHPIPKTYAFLFSWTPEAYNRKNKEKGRREPTDQDWANRAAQSIRLGMKAGSVPKIIRYERRQANRSEFKPYVTPEGRIKRCNDTWGRKYGCTIDMKLSKAVQMQLVQEVLEMHKPNCTIDQIDPAEVLTLRPSNIKSGSLRVVASLNCS